MDVIFNISQVSVLIVDDHKLVTQLIKNFLTEKYKMKNIFVANCGNNTLEIMKENKIDIVLQDIVLQDRNGMELANEILAAYPKTNVIFLTSLVSKQIITDSFKIGAKGYINKTSNLEEIYEAIKSVIGGEKYLCRDSMYVMLDENMKSDECEEFLNNSHELTSREKEVLKLIMNEFHLPEIADKLNLSKRTVETHKKNIMAKLGVRTTVGLVKKVFKKNLNKVAL